MSTRKLIMVIDDEPDIITFLNTLFTDHGYETAAAADGREGLKAIRNRLPDLLIMDLVMPQKSGYRLYKDLCNDRKLKNIPVIVLSGVPKLKETFFAKNPDFPAPAAFFDKPVNRDELLIVVKKLIDKA